MTFVDKKVRASAEWPEHTAKAKDLLVIENVPVVSCPHCGESYLTADTLHEIERLKLHRKCLAIERSVEVVSFA